MFSTVSEYCVSPSQKLLTRQGVGKRTNAIRFRFIRKFAVWFILITIMALFYVWSRVEVVRLGYEVTGMQRQRSDLEKQIAGLKTEVEKLKSSKRLEQVASERLNMHPPSGSQLVFVKPEIK